jgi:protein TonB
MQPKIKIKEQIVNSESENSSPLKVKTRFFGKKTQNVFKQSIARQVGSFKAAGRGESRQKTIAHNPPPKQQKRKAPKGLTLKNLGIGNLLLGQAQAEIRPARHIGSKHGKLKHHGLAQSNDFIDDIPLGDTTYLNTVEFKFFGFYERIRKRLEIFWGTSIQQKARQIISRGGRIPASRNLMTSLLIEINSKGVITNIHIKGSSGYRELDAAAVESFNKAGPFPNPPKDMIKEGRAVLEWGFVVNS